MRGVVATVGLVLGVAFFDLDGWECVQGEGVVVCLQGLTLRGLVSDVRGRLCFLRGRYSRDGRCLVIRACGRTVRECDGVIL